MMKRKVFLAALVAISTVTSASELKPVERGVSSHKVQSALCNAPLSSEQLVRIASKYEGQESNKAVLQIASIDLNGDEFCDLLVEFQEDYSVCPSGPSEDCNLVKQGNWTDFYIATAQYEFSDKAISAERDQWTGGGQYYSYLVLGHDVRYIVWDLRGEGRDQEFADKYTVFKWSEGVNYLDAQIKIDYSVDQEIGEEILKFHNNKASTD